jgi:hypothetical protein
MQGKPPQAEAVADVLHGGVHYLAPAVSVMEEKIAMAGNFHHYPWSGENENGIAPR